MVVLVPEPWHRLYQNLNPNKTTVRVEKAAVRTSYLPRCRSDRLGLRVPLSIEEMK